MRSPLSIDGSRAALLCVDLQEEHRKDDRYLVEGYDGVLGNAVRLQAAARRARLPVLHAAYAVDPLAPLAPFHPLGADGKPAFSSAGDPWTELCPETGPAGVEAVFVKREASAFSHEGVEGALRQGRVEWLFVAGVWTEACIAATVRDAIARSFRVVLVKDACGSGTMAMHETAILNLANRLYGGAIADTDGACALIAGETVAAWQVRGAVPLRFGYQDAASLYRGL